MSDVFAIYLRASVRLRNGTPIAIRSVSANGYNTAFFGPPQTTFKPYGFNNRIGDNMAGNSTVTGPFELDALPLPNATITVSLTDGRTLTQTINTTNGPVSLDLDITGADPFWVVWATTGPQFDTDGVDDYTESFAPNDGDGNDDGVKDALQANVASFPSATEGGSYVTLAAETPGATISNVQTIEIVATPENAPPDWKLPPTEWILLTAVADFEVGGLAPGASETITFYIDSAAEVTGYAKFQDGNWILLPNKVLGSPGDGATVSPTASW